MAKPGIIDIHVKSIGDGRKTKLGSHAQDERFRIETTGKVFLTKPIFLKMNLISLDIHLKLDASKCVQRDVISFTVIISEMKMELNMIEAYLPLFILSNHLIILSLIQFWILFVYFHLYISNLKSSAQVHLLQLV